MNGFKAKLFGMEPKQEPKQEGTRVHVRIKLKDPEPDEQELAEVTSEYMGKLFDISMKYKLNPLDVIIGGLQMQMDFIENTFPGTRRGA